MTKFSIEYNPYLVSCIFKMNGKLLNKKSKIGAKSEERMQILLGEFVNWKGLLKEIEIACDDDEVEITFRGRKIDFDDLKYIIDLYKGSVKFSLIFEETQNDTDMIGALDEAFREIKKRKGYIPEFQTKNEEGKDVFDAYEEVKNGIFEVSVIATMSSGKSTLINSLLHTELLPSENKACTATIAKILDNDDMDGYEAECYSADKTVVYPRNVVSSEMLKKYNADENVTFIDIEGNIPEISSDKIHLCLRDTPGPNNSRDENHGKLTRSIIKNTNAVVLYVMNATQLGINDDKQLLKDIANQMKRAGKQSRDRFIFVINKCDELDVEKGEKIDTFLNTAREELKELGIIEPTLIPTSARYALLIRKKRKGESLSKKENLELELFEKMVNSTDLLHFEKYATLTPTVRECLQNEVDKYHADKENRDLEVLIHTGVPAVEQTICEYIDKYAYPIKIKDAVKDIIGILDELNMKAKFNESILRDENKLKQVREQIISAKERHERSEGIYKDFKSKISNLEVDDLNEESEQFRVEMELQEMTKPYDGATKVDKVEADGLIAEFQEKLEKFQKDCEGRLNGEIDEKIFKKCNEILNEYTGLVGSILDDIEIEGYDFSKINSFEKIKISNINDIKSRNQKDRYREKTIWIDNPERDGFFGWFKFWISKKISYTVQEKDGKDVNVKNIIIDIMNTFSASIKNNISKMFIQAAAQVADYKSVFNDNIDNLKDEITKILYELDDRTKQSGELQKRVAENQELAKWVEEQETRIRTLLEFQEG